MRITYHAGERLLQRVFEFTNYTKKEVIKAMKWISMDTNSVQSRSRNFILPSFPDFRCVVKDNTIVTIVPK